MHAGVGRRWGREGAIGGRWLVGETREAARMVEEEESSGCDLVGDGWVRLLSVRSGPGLFGLLAGGFGPSGELWALEERGKGRSFREMFCAHVVQMTSFFFSSFAIIFYFSWIRLFARNDLQIQFVQLEMEQVPCQPIYNPTHELHKCFYTCLLKRTQTVNLGALAAAQYFVIIPINHSYIAYVLI